MFEQRFKKIFIWLCKKYLTYDHDFGCANKSYLLQKHIQILCQYISFYMIYSRNNYSDGPTNFKKSHNNIITSGTLKKIKHFQEQKQQQQKMKIRAHVQKLQLNIQ